MGKKKWRTGMWLGSLVGLALAIISCMRTENGSPVLLILCCAVLGAFVGYFLDNKVFFTVAALVGALACALAALVVGITWAALVTIVVSRLEVVPVQLIVFWTMSILCVSALFGALMGLGLAFQAGTPFEALIEGPTGDSNLDQLSLAIQREKVVVERVLMPLLSKDLRSEWNPSTLPCLVALAQLGKLAQLAEKVPWAFLLREFVREVVFVALHAVKWGLPLMIASFALSWFARGRVPLTGSWSQDSAVCLVIGCLAILVGARKPLIVFASAVKIFEEGLA